MGLVALCVLAVLPFGRLQAQLSGIVNVPGDYPTLTAAVAAVHAQGVVATLEIHIGNSYNSSSEVYPIVLDSIPGGGSVTITRTPNAVRVATISVNTPNPLIRIQGPNWTIDGRSSGKGDAQFLSLRNNNISNPTIEVSDGATNLTLQYLIVMSADTSLAAGGGAIFMNTTSGFGAQNVAIYACRITSASQSALPSLGICVKGEAGESNYIFITGNEISNCVFAGVIVGTGFGDVINIIDNSVFANTTITSNEDVYGIVLNTRFSGDITVSGNYIGGQSRKCGAANLPMTIHTPWIFTGIFVQGLDFTLNLGYSAPLVVTNNVVNNIKTSYTGDHIIGSSFFGIEVGQPIRFVNEYRLISNNVIGEKVPTGRGITVEGNGHVRGIYVNDKEDPTTYISNNIVGNIKLEGLANSSRDFSRIVGIYGGANGAYVQIDGNWVGNLSVRNAGLFYDNPLEFRRNAIVGIQAYIHSPMVTSLVVGNTVQGLDHYSTDTHGGDCPTPGIAGIRVFPVEDSLTGNLIQVLNNKVYGLSNRMVSGNWDAKRSIVGIQMSTGLGSLITHNMITLDNAAAENAVDIFSFVDESEDNCAFLHNTAYIGGHTNYGEDKSAFYHAEWKPNTTSSLYNNLIYNQRTTAEVGFHGATDFVSNTAIDVQNTWGYSMTDFNVYICNDVSEIHDFVVPGTTLDLEGALDVALADSSSWVYSVAEVPAANLFKDIANGDLHLQPNANQWIANGKAIVFGITNLTDIDGTPMSDLQGASNDIGADEVTPVGIYSNPPAIVQSITGPGEYFFQTGGRLLAVADVTTVGSLTSLALQQYSGKQAPHADVPNYNETTSDYYYAFKATATSLNYTYDAYLEFDPYLMGNIVSVNAPALSQSQPACRSWATYLTEGTGLTSANLFGRYLYVSGLRRDGNFVFTDPSAPLVHPFQQPIGNVTTTTAEVVWSGENLNPGTSYRVEYRKVGDLAFITKSFPICGTSNCTGLLTGLQLGTEYEWRVRGTCFGTGGPLQTFTTASSKMNDTELDAQASGLVVFPNPASSFVNLSLANVSTNTATISLTDMLGREVIAHQVDITDGNLSHSLMLNNVAAGLYVLKVAGEGFSFTQSLVVNQ